MLELTTLMIFTWLTLRVRYVSFSLDIDRTCFHKRTVFIFQFHNYFKDFVLFDIDINNNVIIRWICSFVMTNDPSTNQKPSRQPSTTSMMDNLINIAKSKFNLCPANDPIQTNNLMQFIESIPLESSEKPHPRSGHRAVATESDLWIWGGYYPSGGEGESERMFQEV